MSVVWRVLSRRKTPVSPEGHEHGNGRTASPLTVVDVTCLGSPINVARISRRGTATHGAAIEEQSSAAVQAMRFRSFLYGQRYGSMLVVGRYSATVSGKGKDEMVVGRRRREGLEWYKMWGGGEGERRFYGSRWVRLSVAPCLPKKERENELSKETRGK
ncbi:hypothetical protein MRX96_028609 [Rhipicephalus microplus]